MFQSIFQQQVHFLVTFSIRFLPVMYLLLAPELPAAQEQAEMVLCSVSVSLSYKLNLASVVATTTKYYINLHLSLSPIDHTHPT